MNNSEKLELAHWLANQAKQLGADEVTVDLYGSRDISISMRERKIEDLRESTSNGLSLSIFANHRFSNHSTNDLRRSSLEKFAREAVAMTKYLGEDPYRGLPDPKYYQGLNTADLKLTDPTYESLTSEERVRIASEIEDVGLSQSDQIISLESSFEDSYYEAVKVNSNGFEGTEQGTSFSSGASASVKGKDDGRPSAYDWCTTCFRKDLKSPEELAKTAVSRALKKVGQTKLDSGVYDMVVENRAASRILSPLYGVMTGRALQRKSSFLEGKLGEKIGSEKLTWIDDPFVESGLGSFHYDSDGMAAKRRAMIDKGVLKSFYIDTYYGRRLGMEPTTSSRGNILMEYGDKSLEDLIGMVNKGILVTRFIGGNSNGTTGDFSLGIMGMYVENGRIVKPVNEMNISGNQKELWNQLAEVGNDPYVYSSWRRPSLYFKDIQFSGL